MTKSAWRRRSLSSRIAVPWLLTLILPVILIWTVLFPQLEAGIIDTALTHQAGHVTRLSVVMDQNLSLMLSTAVSYAANPDLRPHAIRQTTLGNYLAIQQLKRSFQWADSFVSQTFYYFKENERFYTQSASYQLPWFCDTSYGYCYYDWPEEEMRADLAALSVMQVRPLEAVAYPENQKGEVISVLLPVPINNGTPYAVLIMWINRSTMESLIGPENTRDGACALIYDGQDQRIFSMGGEDDPELMLAADQLIKGGASPERATLAGQEYFVARAGHRSTGWQCLSLIPVSQVMKNVSAVRLNLIMTTALLMLVCLLLFVPMSARTSLALRRLERKARSYVPESDYRDELDAAHQALDNLSNRTEQLQRRYLETIPLQKERLLYALITGEYANDSAFNSGAAEAGLRFTLPYYGVCALRTGAEDAATDVLEYLESLEESLPRGLEGYFIFSFDRRDILFVCASAAPSTARLYLMDICDDVATTQRQRLYACVGPAVEATDQIMSSYTRAMDGLDRMTLSGQTGVTCEDDFRTARPAPDLTQQPLAAAIIRKDSSQIAEIVESALAFIRGGEASAVEIRALYINTAMLLLQGLDTMDASTPALRSMAGISPRAAYQTLEANLRCLCGTLCAHLNEGQQEIEVSIDEVTAYIHERALSYEFSVQSVAERFNMSYTGFSHYFRRKTGMTCKQFVDEYRAEKAIEILMHTSEPLEKIGQKIGFGSTTSFIRSFKKVTGKTPGSYREM